MSSTILVVEDEPAIQELIAVNLSFAGHKVLRAFDADQAQTLIRAELPDLILLDWMLPGTSGLAMARKLRNDERPRAVPVIMLTAKGSEQDKVDGLEAGADDYVGKPFDPRELLARIEAVLRRKRGPSALTKDAPVSFGPFLFDPSTRQLSREGTVVKLTGGEINLLEALVRNAGKPLSRERLLALARDDDAGERNDRAIDIAILRLRRVIEEDPKQPRWIQTVWGIGYRFSP